MTIEEMQSTRPLYYLLVTIITQFILAMGAVIVLLPTGLLDLLPWSMVGFLLVYNILISALVAVILAQRGLSDRVAILKGSGLVLGHLVGLTLGGFVGAKYGGTLWAIAGAVALYFVVGWIGAWVSLLVGNELDRAAAAALEPPSQIQVRHSRLSTPVVFLTGAVIPLLFVVAAVLVETSGVLVTQYPEVLPTARIVLTLLSIFAVIVPWLHPTQWLRHDNAPLLPQPAVRILALSFCLAPAIFGFLLFMAFGMSLAELSLFAAAASIATATWGAGRT